MALALFDLDNTLLDGDSDYLWGRFLVEQGVVDAEYYERENQRFYQDYHNGCLDIHAFLRFALEPLTRHDPITLETLHHRYMAEKVLPIVPLASRQLLARHRAAGDILLIITATNRFVTAPIAAALGVDHLLATDPQQHPDGRYTGEVLGIPCFREGKVTRLQQWLATHQQTLRDSWFYSDSHNDLPLLEAVANPVAVNPDPLLAATAQQRGWPIISLRTHDETSSRSHVDLGMCGPGRDSPIPGTGESLSFS